MFSFNFKINYSELECQRICSLLKTTRWISLTWTVHHIWTVEATLLWEPAPSQTLSWHLLWINALISLFHVKRRYEQLRTIYFQMDSWWSLLVEPNYVILVDVHVHCREHQTVDWLPVVRASGNKIIYWSLIQTELGPQNPAERS